ncbi:MAG: DUF5615 family PIN-like protein [Pirellulales bacterium]|nr:DUF5615 family PIN-like protein [Pirellulales bacterium]
MILKFKIVENLPVEVASELKNAGHDAVTVGEQALSGMSDMVIAQVCQLEQRVVVSFDQDFAEIRRFPPKDYSGIIVFRLVRQDKQNCLLNLRKIIPLFETEPLVGKTWIVQESRIRIRG